MSVKLAPEIPPFHTSFNKEKKLLIISIFKFFAAKLTKSLTEYALDVEIIKSFRINSTNEIKLAIIKIW